MIGMVVREREKEGQGSCRERVRLAQNHFGRRKSPSAAQLPLGVSKQVCSLHVSGAPHPWTLQEVPAQGKLPQEDSRGKRETIPYSYRRQAGSRRQISLTTGTVGWAAAPRGRWGDGGNRGQSRGKQERTFARPRIRHKGYRVSGRSGRWVYRAGPRSKKGWSGGRGKDVTTALKAKSQKSKVESRSREGGRRARSTFELENAGW